MIFEDKIKIGCRSSATAAERGAVQLQRSGLLEELDCLVPSLQTVRWYSNIKLREYTAAVHQQRSGQFTRNSLGFAQHSHKN